MRRATLGMFKHTLVEFDELETITEDKKRFYLTPEGISILL